MFYCPGDWMLWKAREPCSKTIYESRAWTLDSPWILLPRWLNTVLLAVDTITTVSKMAFFITLSHLFLRVEGENKFQETPFNNEIFGARAITIIRFIEGLLLVHDVAIPIFFVSWDFWTLITLDYHGEHTYLWSMKSLFILNLSRLPNWKTSEKKLVMS